MATYAELYDLIVKPGASSVAVRNKVRVAVSIRAQDILDTNTTLTPTAAEKTWAANAVASRRALDREAARIWPLVVAANSGASVAAIEGASDNAVQNNVNDIIKSLAEGEASA